MTNATQAKPPRLLSFMEVGFLRDSSTCQWVAAFSAEGDACLASLEARGLLARKHSYKVMQKPPGAWACDPAVEVELWAYVSTPAGIAAFLDSPR